MHNKVINVRKRYCKCSKISNKFLFLFSNKMLVFMAGTHKMLVKITNREDLIRLLLQKQSDLGMHYLSMPFWQTSNVRNFRT